MEISVLSPKEASRAAVQALGLDAESTNLTSEEGLAASVRRAASFMCPTSPSRLIDAVLETIRPVTADGTVSRASIADTVDLLVAAGDLLELRHDVAPSVRLLHLGPPSFIEREPGAYLLVGVRPFGAPLVDPQLCAAITHDGHKRTIHLNTASAYERLPGSGLQSITRERWVATPRHEEPHSLLNRLSKRLDAAGPSGAIDELAILDPLTPVQYYRGRWRSPRTDDSGNLVARRPQAYGADLWCFVRLENGRPKKLVELPIDNPVTPGQDEAWLTQLAIDVERGAPQRYRTSRSVDRESTTTEFFSPLPGFAQRYLQLVGQPVTRTAGALFSFQVTRGSMPDLEQFLTKRLWMAAVTEESH